MNSLLREEIIELASKYEDPKNFKDFPMDGDIFAFTLVPTVLPKDWPKNSFLFGGYAVCRGYIMDSETQPYGKWIFMYYDDLSKYPPVLYRPIKLQPPHIAKGVFTSQNREHTVTITKVNWIASKEEPELEKSDTTEMKIPPDEGASNILRFPSRSK